ncbi:GNAT family N-acetyltransferase [Streptomyces sp. DSM 42041]|uniref:GNAT family N-acetyltransferase n=1 Tax=Streptomyces hazeniae TaxID=3075538 RepID=A0ABU2NMY2_9ACTN|nr:GNAT family N-acetyltransferase [Streptomyces sp. DSM 42041]MDT0377417.1 GNAT family N-acetyltransferase [Streptomyces sp. DSM 42041]
MRIRQVAGAHPDAEALRAGQRAEIAALCDRPDSEPGTPPTAADVVAFFVAWDDDARPVGCGGLRALGDGIGDVKRMYVVPEARGTGVADGVLTALEEGARGQGWSALRLETGDGQPAAVRFYERSGYRRIPNFGAYAGVDGSWCFERRLDAVRACPSPCTG